METGSSTACPKEAVEVIAVPGVPDVAATDEAAAQGSPSLVFNGFTLFDVLSNSL